MAPGLVPPVHHGGRARGMSNRRSGYLVLGMHRSGTSAVAGTLAKLGAEAPLHLMPSHPDNPRGYWESQALMEFHDELLHGAGSRWDDWRGIDPAWFATPAAASFRERGLLLLRQEFGAGHDLVMKDPRVCRFAPFWLSLLEEERIVPRVLIPFRLPAEVARSLRARDGMAIGHGLLIWLRHVLDAEHGTRGAARGFLAWDDFLRDWRRALAAVAPWLGANWRLADPRIGTEIDGFLCGGLKRQCVAPELLRQERDLYHWALTAHEALGQLAGDPADAGALRVMDQLRDELAAATALFAPTLADARGEWDRAHQVECACLRAEIDGVRHERNLAARRGEDLAEELRELTGQFAAVAREREAREQAAEGERARLREQITDLHQQQGQSQVREMALADQIRAIQVSRSWRLARLISKSLHWAVAARAG